MRARIIHRIEIGGRGDDERLALIRDGRQRLPGVMLIDHAWGIAVCFKDSSVAVDVVKPAEAGDGTLETLEIRRQYPVEREPLYAAMRPSMVDIHGVAECIRPFGDDGCRQTDERH